MVREQKTCLHVNNQSIETAVHGQGHIGFSEKQINKEKRKKNKKKKEKRKEERERVLFFSSPRNHRPFGCLSLFPIHVLLCHVELACVFYHVCSLMGWLDVIRSVLLQVPPFHDNVLGHNQPSPPSIAVVLLELRGLTTWRENCSDIYGGV